METIRSASPTELVNCSFVGRLALQKLDEEWLRKTHGIEFWFLYTHMYMCMQKYKEREEGRRRRDGGREAEEEGTGEYNDSIVIYRGQKLEEKGRRVLIFLMQ